MARDRAPAEFGPVAASEKVRWRAASREAALGRKMKAPAKKPRAKPNQAWAALAEQNEINQGPANGRRDHPNHEIEAFVDRLNTHRTIPFELNLTDWFCPPDQRSAAAPLISVRYPASGTRKVAGSPCGLAEAMRRGRAASPTPLQDP